MAQLDAFDLPADHIATVNEVSDELLTIVQHLVPLIERVAVALTVPGPSRN